MKAETQKIWAKTAAAALIFLIFYGTAQYIISKEIEPVSLITGMLAFWIVIFILQKAITKQMNE